MFKTTLNVNRVSSRSPKSSIISALRILSFTLLFFTTAIQAQDVVQAETATLFTSPNALAGEEVRIYTDGSATGGQGVAYINAVGNYLEIANAPSATTLTIKYASENTGTITVQVVDGVSLKANFTSTNSWVGSYNTVDVSINISQGATVRIINTEGDAAMNIDELTFVGDPSSCDDGEQNGDETGVDCGGSCDACAPVQLVGKVFLQGALYDTENTLMSTNLTVPSSSPYSDGASLTSGALNGVAGDAIVDWIVLELRSDSDPSVIVEVKSALLQADGDIVSTDGVSVLSFDSTAGDYYVAVDHRNHISVMTGSSISLVSGENNIDFTDDSGLYDGNIASRSLVGSAISNTTSGHNALWSGDADGSNSVNYVVDTGKLISFILEHPSNPFKQLNRVISFTEPHNMDLNMNGVVEFNSSDRDMIIENVLSNSVFNQLNQVIQSNVPQPLPPCENGVQDGDESGIDCGGSCSGVCPPTCDDGIKNGNEIAIDCGGSDCEACPTCDDGIKNGDEEGVDCGGANCEECEFDPCNPTDTEEPVALIGDDFVMGLNSNGIAYHEGVSHSPGFFVMSINGAGPEGGLVEGKNGRMEGDFSSVVEEGVTYTLEVRIQGDTYNTGQCIHSIQVQLGEGANSSPCQTSGGGDTSGGGEAPVGPDPVIAVGSNPLLGAFLTGGTGADKPGFTLYTTTAPCVGGCLDAWPPLLVDDVEKINELGGLKEGVHTIGYIEFGKIDCVDMFQITLDDQPLYFFAQDSAAGDATGHNVGTWTVADVERPACGSEPDILYDAMKTPVNGRQPSGYGYVWDIDGRTVNMRAGGAIQLQFHSSSYVGGVGSVLNGIGDPDWTFVCSCNQVEFHEAEMTFSDYGQASVQIPGNCFDNFYYFFRYKKAGLPSDDPGTQWVYSTLFEYDERTPNDRVDPSSMGTIISNSANWMRWRHPRAHDGNTEVIFNSFNNSGQVRDLDRYGTTVTTDGNNLTINADLPNIIRIEALDNGLIKNANPAYVYNKNLCCGSDFDYGNVITYEISIGSGAKVSSQIYNTFQDVIVGKGFDSAIGDPRLTMAGRASTTMEFSTNNAVASQVLEQDAIFTQHLTTLTSNDDVDDFLEGHHTFHGLFDQFEVKTTTPNFGSAKIGPKEASCQDCHFRDGRGTVPVEIPGKGMRMPPPVYGTGLLQHIDGADVALTWDGSVATVREQTINALNDDHGVAPGDIASTFGALSAGNRQGLVFDQLVAYVEFLTVPNRNAAAYLIDGVEQGDLLFNSVGCADCHKPVQKTKSSGIPEMFRDLVIRPYSDMKLHNVGTGGSFRTPPLWGLGRNLEILERNSMSTAFMHDGRSSSLENAIDAHGGEASSVISSYNSLSSEDKANIVKFLKTL